MPILWTISDFVAECLLKVTHLGKLTQKSES